MPENGRIFIDDLEGAPAAPRAMSVGPVMPGSCVGEREEWLRRRNISAEPIAFEDEDPHSARYTRFDVD